jgi:hypothetical protein
MPERLYLLLNTGNYNSIKPEQKTGERRRDCPENQLLVSHVSPSFYCSTLQRQIPLKKRPSTSNSIRAMHVSRV